MPEIKTTHSPLEGFIREDSLLMGETEEATEFSTPLAFVGVTDAGPDAELLAKMITAMGFQKDQVPCLSLAEWSPDTAQLTVLLGADAASEVLERPVNLATERGKIFALHGASFLITEHPGQLLLHPEMKRQAWEELKKASHFLGVEIPSTQATSSRVN